MDGSDLIVPGVIKALRKLTRSLRYRIYYYSDTCVANENPNIHWAQSDNSWVYESLSEDRQSPDGGLPEANYQAYQQQQLRVNSQSSNVDNAENVDDSLLQEQQMLIPIYCTENLKLVLTLLCSLPENPSFPLRYSKNLLDLACELVGLLTISLTSAIWLATDSLALNISESLKTLMRLIGELMEYYYILESKSYRVTYLQVVCLCKKLLSVAVPLELADIVLPKILKIAITRAVIDTPIYLLYAELSSTLEQYAWVSYSNIL